MSGWALALIFSCLVSLSWSDDILGCGGFLRSSVDIEYSKVQVKLYTKQGSLKYQTDCAPNNGYYFMPVYDKGDYVIKIEPPDGWTFEPSQVALAIDGQTDRCSAGQDIDFSFRGFGVTGQVVSLGSANGPAGVTVTLSAAAAAGGDAAGLHSRTTSGAGGRFTFSPVPAGDYEVTASHPVWRLARGRTSVSVRGDNGDVGQQLAVAGFDLSGQVVNAGEPVPDVTLVLHGRRTSDAAGRFLFPVVPAGTYTVVPVYVSPNTRFDVRPAEVEVTVAQGSAAVPTPFQVVGFTVSGRLLTSVSGGTELGLAGAAVLLDGRPVAVTDAHGRYVMESVTRGQYQLTVEAEAVQFEPRPVSVSPASPVLPDLVAARLRVCGRVELADLPEGVAPGPRTVELREAGPQGAAHTATTEADGAFCLFVRPATYRLRVLVSDEEKRRGLSFGSAQQELAVSAPVSGVQLSPFRARVSGAVACRQPCAGLPLTLTADGLAPRTAVADQGGRFSFEDVLPGQYDVAPVKEEWCWQEASVPVTVTVSDVSDVRLAQTGYALTVVTSHPTALHYRPADGEPAASAGQTQLTTGSNRLCVPTAGAYWLEPRGCHTFAEARVRADTAAPAPLELRAQAHAVSGAVRCEQASDDVRVRLSVDAEARELETSSADRRLHRFSVSARPGQVLTFQPQSDTLLFTPTYHQITAGEDCLPDAVAFQARRGAFISGQIVPALGGARVTVSAAEMEPVSAVTDSRGTYQIGPLHPERQYQVTAEKEGYVISHTERHGHFRARKLAELRVRVTDEQGGPLGGVLVSVSGGKDYRRNSLTDEDGRQAFLSLSPGQYFIRPMMKEYEFTPPSKMAEIAEGATLEVAVSGRRVAYSLRGRVTSVTGEPEPGVTVEAVAGADCQHHQEEAASEPGGALRIRGLRPQCEYTVRLKPDSEANAAFSRGIPHWQTVKVTDGDVADVRLLAVRRLGETDVTVHVQAVDHGAS
ncbi:nodal modulator 2-like [Pollicipes pollicipes]|uniref:nodal modulator 2-like n=1 Tax=Pollicipes pollicipes TaxID=41117 RepID=UPI0018852ED5|nr:nodal modulator 2-like [Pollicipes pollicipes]